MNRFALTGCLTLMLVSCVATWSQGGIATDQAGGIRVVVRVSRANARRETLFSRSHGMAHFFFDLFATRDTPASDSSVALFCGGSSGTGRSLSLQPYAYGHVDPCNSGEPSFQDVFADFSSGGITRAIAPDGQLGPRPAGRGFGLHSGPSGKPTTAGVSVEWSIFALLALGGVCLLGWAAEGRRAEKVAAPRIVTLPQRTVRRRAA